MAATDQLTVRVGERVARAIPLVHSPFKIGRNPDNTLPLQHALVSREHAELTREAQGWTLIDLGSANGTFVDGRRLLPHQPELLAPGAAIRIGPFELTYEPASTPAPAPDRADSPVQPVQAPEPVAPAAAAEPARSAPSQLSGSSADASSPDVPSTPPGAQRGDASLPPPLASAERLCAPTTHPKSSILPARDDDSQYLRYLPVIFHDSDLLRRYLLIFEAIWEPHEHQQNHMELYIDPRTAPESFLSWLASWVDVPISPHWTEERRRKLLTEATNLYRWRGTSYGLSRMIEVCTGLTPTIADGDTAFVFRVQLVIPPGSTADLEFIEDLIRRHKPAYAGYTLEVQP